MDISLVLAGLWGIILAVFCGSMLVNPNFYILLAKGFQNGSLQFLYLVVALIIGAVNVFGQESIAMGLSKQEVQQDS